MDPEIEEAWTNHVEQWMCRTALHDPEPDARVHAWFDEASEADDVHLFWAIQTWQVLRDLPTLELERRLAALRARLGTF